MIELRHLRYFVAVAEERNFSRAAERLHMAQSPLSAAIRQLEQEIGAELLSRGSRGVTMTTAGAVLLERAHRVLEGVEGAVAATRRAAAGELGTLRIGFSWSARFATLPALAQRFAADAPDVTLVTQEMWNADMPGALRSATIDLAVSVCPERERELAYELLRRERLAALVPERHRLAHRDRVDLSDLAHEELVMFPRELAPRLHDALLAVCRRGGFEPTLSRRAFHSAGDTGTLASANGVALAPQSVTGHVPGVVALPLTEDDATLETFLVWHEAAASATAQRFLASARDAAAGTRSA
jgi:DNA-binding transcriptional LysR family regulator